jgi:MFS family permease
LTILMRLFGHNGAELGRAFGFWGAAAAAGGTAGVFFGGVITEWLSWPWTFLINVPLGLLVFGLSSFVIRSVAATTGRIDWIGATLVTAALVTGVYAIVTTEPGQWLTARTVILFGAAVGLLVLFLILQSVERAPLLPLSIFAAPNLALGNVLMALLGAAWIPLWFFLNLYLQQTLNLSAFASGLALLPMTVTIMVIMIGFSGRLVARFGARTNIVAGLLAMGGSLVLFTQLPESGNYFVSVLPASLLAALGMALAYIPVTMTAMSGAKPDEAGLASGIVNTTYQVGSAVGLAMMVVLAESASGGATFAGNLLEGFHSAFLGASIAAFAGVGVALAGLRAPVSSRDVAVG